MIIKEYVQNTKHSVHTHGRPCA